MFPWNGLVKFLPHSHWNNRGNPGVVKIFMSSWEGRGGGGRVVSSDNNHSSFSYSVHRALKIRSLPSKYWREKSRSLNIATPYETKTVFWHTHLANARKEHSFFFKLQEGYAGTFRSFLGCLIRWIEWIMAIFQMHENSSFSIQINEQCELLSFFSRQLRQTTLNCIHLFSRYPFRSWSYCELWFPQSSKNTAYEPRFSNKL